MNKEFIPYEQALELKEIGFNEECLKYWVLVSDRYELFRDKLTNDDIPTPLYQQAFRWFREKYGWIGGVRLLTNSVPGIIGEFTKDKDYSFMIIGTTYEEAELGCLKKLIEIVKNK